MVGTRPTGSLQVRPSSQAVYLRPGVKLGDSLEEFLVEASDDPKLRQILMSMGEAIRTIAYKVKTASCSGSVCINSFAEEQMTVRLLADRVLFEALRYSGVCRLACSEEVPEPIDLGGDGFSVAFDPLDGSTIVDTNFTVGTIFGVWPGDELLGVKGYQQAASGIGIYGPRTGFCITIATFPGTHEFALQDDGKWIHVKETTSIGEGKLFSPGNLRATFDNPGYQELISYYTRERYTLRYTGGMVPDVFQTIKDFDQRSPAVCFGSRAEVERFETIMYGSAPRFDPMTNYRDPIEDFCQSSPDADECRMFDE